MTALLPSVGHSGKLLEFITGELTESFGFLRK